MSIPIATAHVRPIVEKLAKESGMRDHAKQLGRLAEIHSTGLGEKPSKSKTIDSDVLRERCHDAAEYAWSRRPKPGTRQLLDRNEAALLDQLLKSVSDDRLAELSARISPSDPKAVLGV